jgi:hypothetical protein
LQAAHAVCASSLRADVNPPKDTFKIWRRGGRITAMKSTTSGVIVLALLLLSTGCQSAREAYYNSWEKFGYAKRERLVDNVKDARDSQDAAKQQFTSALEQFKSVVNFDGGNLEKMYNKLNSQYKACEDRAGAVHKKIDAVKHVGLALFDEWKDDIAKMSDDPSLQAKSRELYDKTHQSYDEMVARMDKAAASMDPVLKKFQNRVLYVKANLNAAAIASLKGTEVQLGSEIESLVREMEASISEADKFISENQAKG